AYLAQIDYVSFEEMVEGALSRKANPIFLLLDGISDVRNLGAIARSAECAGVDGIVVPERGSAAINADAVKASAGALLRVPTARVPNLRTALYYFRESAFQIVAASEKAEDEMYDVNFRKASVIVMGSEGKGISEPVLSLCTVGARIPMEGKTGSLNVSVAAAVLLFEAVRQRKA
ncbi:MAG: 23S rRNA (guanosine(2251)-2'-O)-methyltransferase RlmB, partial [Bacteroidales bacterium]|nr:23S rRNA (guanosine(2251)-2'-O)-methyltransferase RlmB [Bacteroidales bacterium]